MDRYTQVQIGCNRVMTTRMGMRTKQIIMWYPRGMYWGHKDRIVAAKSYPLLIRSKRRRLICK